MRCRELLVTRRRMRFKLPKKSRGILADVMALISADNVCQNPVRFFQFAKKPLDESRESCYGVQAAAAIPRNGAAG